MAASTAAPAREFRATDSRSGNDSAVQAPRFMVRPLDGNGDGNSVGILQIQVPHARQLACQKAQRDLAAAELTERLRKVE